MSIIKYFVWLVMCYFIKPYRRQYAGRTDSLQHPPYRVITKAKIIITASRAIMENKYALAGKNPLAVFSLRICSFSGGAE